MEASDVTDDSMKVFRVPEQLAEGEQGAENATGGDSSSTRIMGNLVSNTSEESVEGSSVSPGEMSGEESAVLEKVEEGRKDTKVEEIGSDEKVLVGGNLPEAIVALETTADVATSNVRGGGGDGEEKRPDFVSDELKLRETLEGTESANDCALEDAGDTAEKTEVIEEAPMKEEYPVCGAAEEIKIENVVSLETESRNHASASDVAVVPISLETESGSSSSASDVAVVPISLETESGSSSSASDVAVVPISLETEFGSSSSASDVAVVPISLETESGSSSSTSDVAVVPISLETENSSSVSDPAGLPISLETESGNHYSCSDTVLPPAVVVSCEIIESVESPAEGVKLTSEVSDSIGHELKEAQSSREEKHSETFVNETEKSESKPEEQPSETAESLVKAAESKPEEQQPSEATGTIALVDLQTSEKENAHTEEATTNDLEVSQSSFEAAAVVKEETKITPASFVPADSSQDVKVEVQKEISKEKSLDLPAFTSNEIAEDTKSKEVRQDESSSSLEKASAMNSETVDLIDLSTIIDSKVEPSSSNSPDVVPLCEATVQVQNVEDATTVKVEDETAANSDGRDGMIAPTNSPVLTSAPEIISPAVAELVSTVPDIITPVEVTVPSVVESIAATTPHVTTSEVKSEETSAASVSLPTEVTLPSDETTANEEPEHEIKSDVSGAACSDAESKEAAEKAPNKLNVQNLTLRPLAEMWKIVPKGYGSLAPEVQYKRKNAQPKKPRDTRSAASSSSEAELKEDNPPRRKRKSVKDEALSATKLEKSVAEEIEPIDLWTNPAGPVAPCSSAGVSAPELKPSCSTGAGTSAPKLNTPSLFISKQEEVDEASKNIEEKGSDPAPPVAKEKPADVSTSGIAREKVIDDRNQLSQRWSNREENLMSNREEKLMSNREENLMRKRKNKPGKNKQFGRENNRPEEARCDEMEQQQQQPLSGPAPPFKSYMPQSFPDFMPMPNVSPCGIPNVRMRMIPQMVRNSPSSSEGPAGGTHKDFGHWVQNPSGQPAQQNSRGRDGRRGQLKSIQPEQVPVAARSQSVGQRSHDSDGRPVDKNVQFRLYRCPNTSCKREWRVITCEPKSLPCKECQTIVHPFRTRGKVGSEARCFFKCPVKDCGAEWNRAWYIGRPRYCHMSGCVNNGSPVFAYREEILD